MIVYKEGEKVEYLAETKGIFCVNLEEPEQKYGKMKLINKSEDSKIPFFLTSVKK